MPGPRSKAAAARLLVTLAAIEALQYRPYSPPAGYKPSSTHTLAEPLDPRHPEQHPATDPARWLGFI